MVLITGVSGVVTNIGLRTTKLRDIEGTTHIMPNGIIELVSNMTKDYSQALIDVEVAYKEDLDRVREVLLGVGREMMHEKEYGSAMLEEPEVLGVEAFGASGVTVRMIAKTAADQKFAVTRELRRRIKIAFDLRGIEIPYPHQKVLYYDERQPNGNNGNGSKPSHTPDHTPDEGLGEDPGDRQRPESLREQHQPQEHRRLQEPDR